jgi:hypothetical protein
VWSVAIVGVECVWECLGAFGFGGVAVGVCRSLEQGAVESFCFPVCLWSVGPRLVCGDSEFAAGVVPASVDAGAVVGEHALDPDPVAAV